MSRRDTANVGQPQSGFADDLPPFTRTYHLLAAGTTHPRWHGALQVSAGAREVQPCWLRLVVDIPRTRIVATARACRRSQWRPTLKGFVSTSRLIRTGVLFQFHPTFRSRWSSATMVIMLGP